MIALFSVLAVFSLLVLVMGLRLLPLLDGNASRLDVILSDESLSGRYRPMARLLQERDWEYLSAQPGFPASKVRAIRAQRRGLFRQYLRCLICDFGSICLILRGLMVQSTIDRPDLAKAISRQRMAFVLAIAKIEMRLVAHAVGFSSVRIDISGLVRAMEELGAQARQLQLLPEAGLA
jgi:hypothetical protein